MKCFGRFKHSGMYRSFAIAFIAATLSLCTFGQVQNTIYRTVIANSIVTGPVTLGPLFNIGQNFHQISITFGDVGGCIQSNSDFTANFIGSAGPANIGTDFGFPVDVPQGNSSAPTVGQTILYEGVGAYPFIYVQVNSTTLAGCNYSIQYSGSISPVTPQPQLTILRTLNKFQTSASSFSMGTSSFLVAIASNLGTQAIYELAVGSTVATPFTLTCTANMFTFVVNIPAQGTVVFPFTGLVYFTCPASSGITATVTAAATVSVNFRVFNQRQF